MWLRNPNRGVKLLSFCPGICAHRNWPFLIVTIMDSRNGHFCWLLSMTKGPRLGLSKRPSGRACLATHVVGEITGNKYRLGQREEGEN